MHNFTDLQQFLDRTVQQLNVPAAFCVCSHNHRQIFSHTAGCDAEVVADSTGKHFWIYSATKIVTAVVAMQMVQDGLLQLSAPVSHYLPEYGQLSVRGQTKIECVQPLLVEHLLTMQGGFDYILTPPAVQQLGPDATTRQVIKAYADKPLDFVPGSHFQYSLCLDILGGVLEAAAGMTLGSWMKQRIFDPLCMTHTGFSPSTECFAPQFRQDPDGQIRQIENENFCRVTARYESGGGGLYSTIKDYCLFANALACGGTGVNGIQILQPEYLDMLRVNRLSGQSLQDFRRRYTRPGYGYGYGVRTALGSDIAQPQGTFGWDGAAGVHVLIDPSNQLSMVYFQHVQDMEILYDHIFPQMDALLYSAFL